MTEQDIKNLFAQLEKRKKEIEIELGTVASENPAVKGDFEPRMPNYDDDTRDEDAYVHEVSDMTANVAYEQQLENELEDIKVTMDKIKNGRYGNCENCSQPIASERLKAMPVAKLCISCAKEK